MGISIHPSVQITLSHKPLSKEEQRELLSLALSSEIPSCFSLGHYPSGRPYLIGAPQYTLSLSHCPMGVGFVFASREYEVGIDIESREVSQEVVTRISSEDERRLLALNRLPPALLWSVKEAVYKLFSEKISGYGERIVMTSIAPSLLGLEEDLWVGVDVTLDDGQKRQVRVQILRRTIPIVALAIYPTPSEPVLVTWRDH